MTQRLPHPTPLASGSLTAGRTAHHTTLVAPPRPPLIPVEGQALTCRSHHTGLGQPDAQHHLLGGTPAASLTASRAASTTGLPVVVGPLPPSEVDSGHGPWKPKPLTLRP